MKKIIIKILYKIISIIDKINFGKYQDKIIESYNINENIYVKTDTGFSKISYIHSTKPFEIYTIKLKNNYELECADEHIVFDENFNEIFVKDLSVGNYIQTDKGLQQIISLTHSSTKISMGDITVNDNNHRFYSNGILSHNSVTTAIYCLWKILFNTDKKGLILSKSGPAGVDLLSKIKDMYLYLPYHLKIGTNKWNQTEISFDNNSSISTEAFSSTAGLGKTINFLILDEFAWCPTNEVDLFYNNIIPTITTITNSNVCIMSTQNGFNKFYELWKAATEGRSEYAPFKVDWYQVPQWNDKTKKWEKRDQKWKDMMVGILGSEEAFQYQYGTQFSASDKCLISRETLSELRDVSVLWTNRTEDFEESNIPLTIQHPEFLYWKNDFDFNLLKTDYFLVIVDLAEGLNKDFTVFNIFKLDYKDVLFTQVGRWYTNTVDLEKAALEFWLLAGQLFNNERCIWSLEWNTYGALFYNYIMNFNESDYDKDTSWRFNILNELDLFNFCQYKKQTMDEQIFGKKKHTSNFIPGIKFTAGNKSSACALLKMLFEKKQVSTTDLIAISEIENFEDQTGNGSYKAAYGHDDIIMTFAQLPMVQQTTKYKDLIEEIEVSRNKENIESKWDNNYEDDISEYMNNLYHSMNNNMTYDIFDMSKNNNYNSYNNWKNM